MRLLTLTVVLISAVVLSPPLPAAAHSPHDDISDIAVYASDAGHSTILVISRSRLLRSSDAGETWRELIVRGSGRDPLARVAVSPADPQVMFVTTRGEGVYRSRDGGTTWAPANGGLQDLHLQEVAASPVNPDVVVVAGPLSGLYRSTDAGDSWSPVPSVGLVTAMTFAADGSGRLVIADATGGLSISDDVGRTWEHSVTPGGSGAVTAIASGSARDSPSLVLAARADGTVLRSADAGESFNEIGRGLPSGEPRGIAISPRDDQTIWISTASDGAFRSTDGGKSWELQRKGLTKSPQADDLGAPHFRSVRIVEEGDGEVLFLAGFDGLFRSEDGGRRWLPVETAADYIAGLAVSPDFENDRTVVVMSYVKGGFISHDGGQSWRPMNGGLLYDGLSEGNRLLPLRRGHNVVFSPAFAEDRTIFSAHWPRLIKSEDAGESWSEVQLEPVDASPLRQYVLAVSPNYAADQTVYAGNRYGQIFRSQAAGDADTWSSISTVDGRVRTVAISPAFASDRVIFVSSVGGVFKSEDAGLTWVATGPGPSPNSSGGEADPAPMLAMSPEFATDATVFAGTDRGLFVTRDAGRTWSAIAAGPLAGTADIAAVGVSAEDSGSVTVLVSVQDEGLYRSIDGGTTFTEVGTELTSRGLFISDYDNPTSSPIQFSRTYAADGTVFAYAGVAVVRSADRGKTWDVLELPSVAEVAESLGFDLAGAPAPATAGSAREGGSRRTFDTPFGKLSLRRLVAATGAAVVVFTLLTVVGVGASMGRRRAWTLRLLGAAAVFLVGAAVLAA